MSWWFHPDRGDDLRKRLEESGNTDVSVTESTTTDGVRVRAARWKGSKGWDHHQRTETTLDPSGMAARSDHIYVAEASDVVSYESPSGQKLTTTCSGRVEFIPLASGQTTIRVVHHHVLVGGSWVERRSHRRAEQLYTERVFRERIARCQAAVGVSVS